jgi:hypothetical protein
MPRLLKVNGQLITHAGLICKVLSETPTRFRVEVVGLFFPRHKTRWGFHRIDPAEQAYLRELIIGQKREFWSELSPWRSGYEVGGDYVISNWHYRGSLR